MCSRLLLDKQIQRTWARELKQPTRLIGIYFLCFLSVWKQSHSFLVASHFFVKEIRAVIYYTHGGRLKEARLITIPVAVHILATHNDGADMTYL